jgi:hypothetical protein
MSAIIWNDKGRPERNHSYVPEVEKARALFMPYIKGVGLDLGCGCQKITREAIGVDCDFIPGTTNIAWDLNADLYIIAAGSLDYIFSAHLLEHLVSPVNRLDDWWSKIHPGGFLCLYLPHGEYIGQQGPDHLWRNLHQGAIRDWMRGKDYQIVLDQDRPRDPVLPVHLQEFSFALVLRRDS